MQGRLIAVSNRVAIPKAGKVAGGLAVGVLAALEEQGGIWFGWSGKKTGQDPRDPVLETRGRITYATIDLKRRDFENYYNGFSNNSLWPLCHYMLGFFSFRRFQYDAYCRVNELFARKLVPLLEPDDIIWVHDYHLIPLAAELRRAGVTNPIGFFLHVPFPSFDALRALPPYEHLLRSMSSYDVIGFQTETDLRAFQDSMRQPEIGGRLLDNRRIEAYGRTFCADVFPIGVDVEDCRNLAAKNIDDRRVHRLTDSLRERKLIMGVDRLDYSKGLELRFRSFQRLLKKYPTNRGQVVFLQIAPPTRTGVRTYDAIREELELASGNINGRFAEMDWVPIRYLNRAYDRGVLMSLLRLADIGLVTPIRDGMNLVAKEYLATQDPKNPGVLVLSTLAGAARELTGAVLVNPYDREGVADGMQQAIEMRLEERRERYQSMIGILQRNDIHAWCSRFIESLRAEHAAHP